MSCYSDETRATQMKWTMESIKRCAELAIEVCEGESREEQLNKLTDLMSMCCFLENKHGVSKAALLDIQKILRGHSDSEAGNNKETDRQELNVRELFNREMEESSGHAADPQKHSKYISFKNHIDELLLREVAAAGAAAADDGELAFVYAEVLTVDPITKQTMTDPVRIKQCGHTFEKSSIMSLLKNRHHIKCPLPGCLQTSVHVTDLEEHHELKLRLDQDLRATQTDRTQ